MSYLIGTDEAGYGPNLGPLVISATVWRIDDETGDSINSDPTNEDLYARLAPAIVAKPRQSGPGRVAMADSKSLYTQSKRLRHLERGLFAALGLIDRRPRDWTGMWTALDLQSGPDRDELPWHEGRKDELPIEADAADLQQLEASLLAAMQSAGVRLVDVRSRAVFPSRFNRMVDQSGSKGTVLSQLTLDLLAGAMSQLDSEPTKGEPIKIVCDKHGGRDRYGELLARHFPQWSIKICEESRQLSSYRLVSGQRRAEISFQVKGESWLPAALASMASKYLRELAMRAFNDFWCGQVADLKPTAGYPLDATRFKAQIAALQEQLGIADNIIWRNR